jgi:hypothetical protein
MPIFKWDAFAEAILTMLPVMIVLFIVMGAMLGYAWWRDSKIVYRRYAFRADLMIQRGCPTIYQGCHIILPARSLEDAQEVAERIGNLNDTSLSYDPEFRHG